MSVRNPRLKVKLAAVLTASATVAALGVGGATAPAGAAGPSITPHKIKVDPLIRGRAAANPTGTFGCQNRPMDGSQGPRCYQASQMENAYDVTPLLNKGLDGTGRTIVIIDAFGNPTMAQDLKTFDAGMGLPDTDFSVIAPFGTDPFDINDPNQFGWAVETTLDVEWAHAIAPGAKIVLAVARSNNDTDIFNVQKFVIQHNIGDVISQSFGEAEECMDPALLSQTHTLFRQAANRGITVFASSGDSGAAQPSCDGTGAIEAASTPASDPFVTGVGGTTLTADTTTGAYQSETAWTEPFGCNPPAVDPTDVNCSGGGFSKVFKRPDFQKHALKSRAARGVPDVAYNAGLSGGVLITSATITAGVGLPPDPPGQTTFFIVGGTSAGTPQWAGLAAIADQIARHRLGTLNETLYDIGHNKNRYADTMHDITIGNNDVAEIGGGFDTAKNWDPVTGLGTPKASTLLPMLVKRSH
jgi:subtilase family serine protease